MGKASYLIWYLISLINNALPQPGIRKQTNNRKHFVENKKGLYVTQGNWIQFLISDIILSATFFILSRSVFLILYPK